MKIYEETLTWNSAACGSNFYFSTTFIVLLDQNTIRNIFYNVRIDLFHIWLLNE